MTDPATGTTLLTRAAEAGFEQLLSPSMYLRVLERNSAARLFYGTLGGTCV
ncbi:hypothetical protein [Streptomyces sp. 039-1]|uniref:hypothetical protein n=1 Tax=Streptomyces sp. 039-1 TaxID=2789263 RepID=UPI0039F64261